MFERTPGGIVLPELPLEPAASRAVQREIETCAQLAEDMAKGWEQDDAAPKLGPQLPPMTRVEAARAVAKTIRTRLEFYR